jgi:hypothetical protein
MAYHHLFLCEGYACEVCDWLSLPSLWLGSPGDYSPTVPSIRLVHMSRSHIGCEPVQVYYLNLLFHIMIPNTLQTVKILLLVSAGKLLRVVGAPTVPALNLCAASFSV